jgi:hypothetical protein
MHSVPFELSWKWMRNFQIRLTLGEGQARQAGGRMGALRKQESEDGSFQAFLRSKASDVHQRPALLALQTIFGWVIGCLPTASMAEAETIPLPRDGPTSSATEATTEVSPCQLRLAKIAEFRPTPSITGPGECMATDVVTVEAALLPDGQRVVFSTAAAFRRPGKRLPFNEHAIVDRLNCSKQFFAGAPTRGLGIVENLARVCAQRCRGRF